MLSQKKIHSCLFGAFIATLALPVVAARPFITDDPGTTERGKFELEVSSSFWKKNAAFGMVFKHGLTERMELDIPVGYCASPDSQRLIYLPQLYGKFALVPDVFAATFTATFGDPSYNANLIVSKSFGFFKLIGNLGGLFVGSTNDADLIYGVSGIFTFGRFETGAELVGTQEALHWWQIGAKYFFTDWLCWDVGLGGDIIHSTKFNATTGLLFAFPISKEKKGE